MSLNAVPPGTLIYHDVAPRQDDYAARSGNAGERLAYARLPTGIRDLPARWQRMGLIQKTANRLRRIHCLELLPRALPVDAPSLVNHCLLRLALFN